MTAKWLPESDTFRRCARDMANDTCKKCITMNEGNFIWPYVRSPMNDDYEGDEFLFFHLEIIRSKIWKDSMRNGNSVKSPLLSHLSVITEHRITWLLNVSSPIEPEPSRINNRSTDLFAVHSKIDLMNVWIEAEKPWSLLISTHRKFGFNCKAKCLNEMTLLMTSKCNYMTSNRFKISEGILSFPENFIYLSTLFIQYFVHLTKITLY